MKFDYVLCRKCMQNLWEAAGSSSNTSYSAPAIVIAERVTPGFQPSRNVLDSQGFDSYVKDQGLPKWSPIVCQGSGHCHDVYCGQPAGYDNNNGYSN